MSKLKKRILDLEKKMNPEPPPVLYSETDEEATEKLKQYYADYPDGPKPLVYVVPKYEKPLNAGMSSTRYLGNYSSRGSNQKNGTDQEFHDATC